MREDGGAQSRRFFRTLPEIIGNQLIGLRGHSGILLTIIVGFAVAAAYSLREFESPALGIAFIVAFGVAVAIACLFVFPYANIWEDSGAHLDYLDTRTGAAPYANFEKADFQGATLFGAYLNNANLTGAKLNTPRNADGSLRTSQRTLLRFTSFRRANLTQADLSGADLGNADMRDATLRGANLADAELHGARLEGADLAGARLATAQLIGASYDLATKWPDDRWVKGAPDGDQRTSKLCRVKACLIGWRVVETGTPRRLPTS